MKTLRFMLTLMTALIAAGAMAQSDKSIWELNKTYRGDGEETVNNKRNRDFSSVNVNLRNDGTATVRFMGDKNTDFNGRWRGPTNNIVTVDVHERDSTGYFRVFLEDREIRRVEGTVRRKDDAIRIVFKCEIVRGAQRPGWDRDEKDQGHDRDRDRSERDFDSLFGTKSNKAVLDTGGRGSLRRDRNDWQVKRAKVEIKDDGNIMIQIKGDKNETFRGKWRRDSNGRISFTITDAFGDKKATGSGWLTFKEKDEVDLIRANFRAKKEDYSLGFTREK
ncbi:MAG: hypothetical protein KF784_02725 [Fimbriimonadaceae bacterium]|nr:hypothetical protein [Fimbriimonadaceae bacterium]